MAHQNRLANAHILVFGGTSGIGFAIASMALSYGAKVTISGSNQPKVDTKVDHLRSLYPNMPATNVKGFAADLTDKANLERNIGAVLDKATENGSKKIDHIAFTSGDSLRIAKTAELGISTVLDAFTVRFLAPCALAKLIVNGDYMLKSSNSSITLTAGSNTKRPMQDWAVMAAVGGSLEGLTRGLAVDMVPIRINLVNPGAIHTEMLQKIMDRLPAEAIEKMKKSLSLPGEIGRPEDIAEAYGWIMKDRFANGAEVNSDGGRYLVGSTS
ncbi:hypothetical protein COCCADRAFT_23581 [Bipolaris zeicola 26-R-13]|uniref:NAD(P)-binding protein n=1 Tax=Cochliobolus carbonum (strain 26-R-13) TaxID=930089 RepID=W6YB19_COCC2|nr:uncharacterized protein COCCADRAFT_23581 [Bipolaris zeicola 26-R-13]EUC36632.1 hypothetical protein COCCADRAFT_23581 [Bipolaris zeicola 26-R-13]